MDKPLISFVIVTYNQEKLVHEAVESALAQTYSPLEIIISDDASKDRTFEVIRQTVADYKGPHAIRLNRNDSNLGMGRHLNRVMELCAGELVIAQAGDDISVPERAEVTHQAWEKSGRRATSVFSSYTTIFINGEVQGVGGLRGDCADDRLCWPLMGSLFQFLSSSQPVVNGPAHAFSPELFRYFGPLKSDLEDLVLSFRTLAIGELLYVHRPLVKYRRHEHNMSFFVGWDDTRSFEHRERRLLWVNRQSVAAYDTMLSDIEVLCSNGRITSAERDSLVAEALRIRRYYAVELRMMESRNVFTRFGVIFRTARQGHLRCALRCSVRVLPSRLYKALYLLRGQWRKWRNRPSSATTPVKIP